jgi:hypothetical protein
MALENTISDLKIGFSNLKEAVSHRRGRSTSVARR